MFSVSTILGEKASDVEQSREESTKLLDRRPPPRWTGRGQGKEGIMFGKFSAFLSVFFFFFFFLGVCIECVMEWMCE